MSLFNSLQMSQLPFSPYTFPLWFSLSAYPHPLPINPTLHFLLSSHLSTFLSLCPVFCLFAPLFDRLRTERHWQSGGHQQASEAIWAFAGTRNWRSTTVKCQEFTMVREKARGERVATKRARCEARARQRPKAGEKGGEAKGVAEQEISAATTTYGSVAGTLDERSRSIELPGSPSLCLSLSLSFSIWPATISLTTVSLSRILCPSFSPTFTLAFATRTKGRMNGKVGQMLVGFDGTGGTACQWNRWSTRATMPIPFNGWRSWQGWLVKDKTNCAPIVVHFCMDVEYTRLRRRFLGVVDRTSISERFLF